MPSHKECINNVWPEMKKQVFVRQFYKGLMILTAGGNGGKILILFIYLLYRRIKKGLWLREDVSNTLAMSHTLFKLYIKNSSLTLSKY